MNTDIICGIAEVSEIRMPYASVTPENGGSGKTLVIIPGLSVKQVTPMVSAVAEHYKIFTEAGYRIFLFDRRINAPCGYSVQDMAADTAAVMNYLGIEKADIFGASQGGMIALCIAEQMPEMVDHLIVGSSAARYSEQSERIVKRWISLAEKRDEQALNMDVGKTVFSEKVWKEYGEGIMAGGAGITEEEYRRFIIMASALPGIDLLADAGRIRCRTLVIGASGDRIFPESFSKELANAVNGELYLYGEEYGHGVYDEAPDYADRIFSFCEK